MKNYDTMSTEELAQQSQLFQDLIPYYGRISVYDMDRSFIESHLDQCLRMALAGKTVILSHPDILPENAIFSDEIFSQLIQEAWNAVFSTEDKVFLNENLQKAAECFRMGFMMADLPEM